MKKHSTLIWLAAFTIFFAILAWPVAVHAQGSYGSTGGTFITASYSSSGGTYIARRTPTQVLPRARSFQPFQKLRSLLKRQTVNVAQTPVVDSVPVTATASSAQCSCVCFCPKCGNKLTCQCDCTADKNSVTCPACGYVSDCPCDCKSTTVTAKKDE